MDSGNSGSLQSSSGGGDDEFDSLGGGVDSSPLAALLRPTPSPAAGQAFSQQGSPFGLRDFASGPPPRQQQQTAPWSAQLMAGASSSSSRMAPSDAGAHQGDPSATAQGAAAAAPAPPRGSRKRARSSRRAPTTVLTTDTSNFRAMVQEFTGIPSPPFGAGPGGPGGASFHSRFDHLFATPSTLRSAADPASSLPPYLLRPFAQKLATAPSPFSSFASPSSSAPTSSNIGAANVNATSAPTTAAPLGQPADAGDAFQLTSSALLRMQQDPNSYLSFQNLLGSSSQQPMFGGFSQAAPRLHEPPPSEFLSHGGMMGSEGLHMQRRNDAHHGGDELSGVVASGSGSCKVNYTSHAGGSSSSAAASTDMPPDGAGASGAPARPARGQGLDPWICTSE